MGRRMHHFSHRNEINGLEGAAESAASAADFAAPSLRSLFSAAFDRLFRRERAALSAAGKIVYGVDKQWKIGK